MLQKPVRKRQQCIQCNGCLKWNHRSCNSGISQEDYRAAVRARADIILFCPSCSLAESETDILESEESYPP
ncbi:unnamed protein product [Porites lobata]|uniref:Uncharacterized protein n=1 Tax=Porites lobata TaxID=104759 RepID=A0ABN8NQG4_9CNID|nr:unnamed protein product [Porites lobata]